MKINSKIVTTYLMLVSSIVFAAASFVTPPEGEISDSVLWYISQSLVYAATALGINSYVDYRVKKFLEEKEVNK